MMKKENVKGRGFKRKTSLGLVCGISLMGAIFFSSNAVSADEATPTTPTPTATTNESKTVVVDEGLTETANKAKEAGLTVNAEPTKNIGTANTEEEATKLSEQAKKDVADQKAEIEKAVETYKSETKSSEAEKTKLKDQVTKNPLVYDGASAQLADSGDVDFNNNKVTFGEFKSSKGAVKFVNAPSNNVNLDDSKSYQELVNAGTGTQKEINTFYEQGNMFGTPTSVADRKNLKAVPIAISEGESITYKLNYAEDSELGKLGVATVEKQVTLVKSPVNTGKVVLLADRYGSVSANFLIGGEGKRNEVLKTGDWTYRVEEKYLDKNGKNIDPKELTAKVYNKYAFGGKDIVKASDFTLPSTPMNRKVVKHNVNGMISETKSTVVTYAGNNAYFVQETTETIVPDNDPTSISPYGQVVKISSQKLQQIDTSKLTNTTKAPTVNYHLVSYTVNKPKATNNADTVKKGSIVQVFIEEGGKEIAPKTNTGVKPVDEAVKLSHPNEITFEGKTYTFTRQDKVDPTKIPNGTETITYIYKLKETPKPTPAPTPTPVEKPTTIHIDGNTGKEIAPKEDGTKPFKTIDGYEPSPKDPKNVENPKGETVRVYNIIKKGNVEVRYVKDDASRTVLKEPVADTVGGKVGSDYDTTDHKPTTITKDGVTYELVRAEGTEKGKVVEGKTVVTYVYRQAVEPTTIHIDEEGNRIAPPEKGTKPFKNIDGFEPSPKNPKNVENPKGETVRVYKVVKGDVEVRYIKDDKERTVLKEPVADTTQAKVGTKYDTTDHKPVTITKDGVTYELVRTEGVEKGDVVKGKTVVTYVYREVQKPITIHIDTEGNPVAPQEDGTKPFKEIEGYKPAPKDSKNVEDPKGVTVRVYDKVKPEAPQEAPKTPEKPEAPKPTAQAYVAKELPNTGSEASTALALAGMSILGLSVLAYKKKED